MRSNAKAVFKKIDAKLKRAIQMAPKVLANEGQNVFLENFKSQAWLGQTPKKWAKRKDKRIKRPVLIGRTRKLIGSVRRSVKEATNKRIRWGTSVPYADVHNNGYNGIINRKAHKRNVFGHSMSIKTRRHTSKKVKIKTGTMNVSGSDHRMHMPQRKFMGTSPKLRARLINKYYQIFKEHLR